MLNLHPKDLGLAPFVPAIHSSVDVKARELGLQINSSGNIHVLPTIASFVGADTSAMILAEEPHKQDENWLLIDVGTNAELVLGNRKRLVCTSTPTVPRSKARTWNMGCAPRPARSSASTLMRRLSNQDIKSLAWMAGIHRAKAKGHLRLRHHRFGGRIVPGRDRRFAGQVQKGLELEACSREGESGWEYVIAWAEETSIGRDIPMTQQDVRQIQLAKAALFAAARTLLKRSGLQTPDKIILAGGFGSYIDKEKAMLIGLIPDCELENVYAVGNAAGDGARIALVECGEAE